MPNCFKDSRTGQKITSRKLTAVGTNRRHCELSAIRSGKVKNFLGVSYYSAITVSSGSISSRIMFSMAIRVPVSELGQLPQAPS